MAQTGPKTLQGRERSSRNAIKHGLTSNRMFVFDNESPEKWQALLRVWTDKLQPRDEAEMCVVLDIAHAQWKLRRARTYESALMDAEMEEQAETLEARYEEVDEGIRQASAFKSLSDDSRALDLLHRYETRARRAFERGLATLEKLRAMAPPAARIATEPAQVRQPGPTQPAKQILQNEIPGPSEHLEDSPACSRPEAVQNENAPRESLPAPGVSQIPLDLAA